jgi:heterodisulfide reductase subunit A
MNETEKTQTSPLKVRIGVFVCHCGNNIAGTVRVAEVVDYAKTLPGVSHAEANLYTCSEDGLSSIKKAIAEHGLNRVVVASCTPRTHEILFRRACEEAGVNKYLFEFVNLREHCSWIHMGLPDEATDKARDLVRMGAAKARNLEPQEEKETEVYPAALVIGGGMAGMAAAQSLARQGLKVHLVEKEKVLGGLARHAATLFPTDEDGAAVVREAVGKVRSEKRIKLHLSSTIDAVRGFIGNFDVAIRKGKQRLEFKVGTIIVAVGAEELKPAGLHGYGKIPGVLTQLELGDLAKENGLRGIGDVVMVNCAGARIDERTYCGRFCCLTAMKNAILLKEKDAGRNVTILHRGVMAYGTDFERYYGKALEKNVRFIQYDPADPPRVEGNGRLEAVTVRDMLTGREIELPADRLVLTTPLVARPENQKLAQMLKVPTGQDGFFLEAHLKLRPVEFSTDGIYVCGSARYPCDIRESTGQALAAAAKAAIPLVQGKVRAEAITAFAEELHCTGCGACETVCPFSAIEMKTARDGRTVASVIEAMCKGCGCCAAACPSGAMQQKGFSDRQLFSMIEAYAREIREKRAKREEHPGPYILAFACNWCSYAGADLAGVSRLQMPPNTRVVRVMCSARVKPDLVIAALAKGIDGVLILGCHPGDCHYTEGNYYTRRRAAALKSLLTFMGYEPERFQLHWISAAEGARFAATIREAVEAVGRLTANEGSPIGKDRAEAQSHR